MLNSLNANIIKSKLNLIWGEIEHLATQPMLSFSDISGRGFFEVSLKLINLHEQIAQLYEHNPVEILQRENFVLLADCRKNLKKIDRFVARQWNQALEKVDQKTRTAFYQKVEEVWKKTFHGEIKDKDFGRNYFEAIPGDVLVVQAIKEHIWESSLKIFLEALMKKDWRTAFLLFAKFPLEKRLEIEEKLKSFCPTEIPDFTERFIAAAKEEKIDDTFLQGVDEKAVLASCMDFVPLFPPIYHHVLKEDEYDPIEEAKKKHTSDAFFKKVEEVLQRTGLIIDTAKFIAKFPKHPVLYQAVKELDGEVKRQVLDLKIAFCSDNWEKFDRVFQIVPESEKEKFYVLIANAYKDKKGEELSEDPLVLGRNYVQRYLKKHGYDSLIAGSLEKWAKIASSIAPVDISTEECSGSPGLFYSVQTLIPNNNISDALQNNLTLAYEALVFALSNIRYSSNFVNREDTGFNSDMYTKDVFDNIVDSLNDCCENIARESKDPYFEEKFMKRNLPEFSNQFVRSWITDKLSQQFGIGNCEELATEAFFYLLKKKHPHLRVELMSFNKPGGDHAFVVLGRKPGSDENDVSTWGDEAVICDPWARKIFPASLAKKYLQNYIELDCSTGLPNLEAYHPLKHQIKVIVSNTMSTKEFLASSVLKEKAEVGSLLNKFNHASNYEEKKQIALKILNLPYISQWTMTNDLTLNTLISQLRFFVTSKIARKYEKKFYFFDNKMD